MERAAAVVVAGIGLVLLTLAALVYAGPDVGPRSGGVELAAVVTRPRQPAAPATTATEPPATSLVVPSTVAPTSPSTVAPASPVTGAAPSPSDAGVPPALAALLAEISSGGIRFEVGAADLDERARQLLDGVPPLLVGRDDILLVVRGHTDSTGGPDINGPLGVQRAQVVADYLVALGVPSGRIQVIGLGADAPVADNATIEGRQANRRSEITTVDPRG